MSAFKICIIGAGSVGFTKKLCADILRCRNSPTSRSH